MSRKLSLTYPGATIVIKPALTKRIRGRIWVLRKVEEMLTKDPRTAGKKVLSSVDGDGTRTLKVGDTIAFVQRKNTNGEFVGEFVGLSVPVPK